MKKSLKWPGSLGLSSLLILILTGILIETSSISGARALEKISWEKESLVFLEENTLWPIPNPELPQRERKIFMIVTGYSSSPWETDDSPYLTAAGTLVREGVVANNLLAFGTKIKIPEIFGDKIFVVEDRMSWEKGNYHIDIWFPNSWQALNFGVKRTYIEILEG